MRILLVDDHEIFRDGLRRILEEEGGFEVVGEATNGLEAIERAAALRPDVILMDIGLEMMNGTEATTYIVRKRLGRVVVLSMYTDDDTVVRAIRAGAVGYVSKGAAGRELIQALQAAERGEVFLSSSLCPRLRETLARTRAASRLGTDRLSSLTPRQRLVLQLVAEGHTSKEIGRLLDITAETVKSHRKNLMKVLGIRSVAGLTHFALEHGLVHRPTPRPPTR